MIGGRYTNPILPLLCGALQCSALRCFALHPLHTAGDN